MCASTTRSNRGGSGPNAVPPPTSPRSRVDAHSRGGARATNDSTSTSSPSASRPTYTVTPSSVYQGVRPTGSEGGCGAAAEVSGAASTTTPGGPRAALPAASAAADRVRVRSASSWEAELRRGGGGGGAVVGRGGDVGVAAQGPAPRPPAPLYRGFGGGWVAAVRLRRRRQPQGGQRARERGVPCSGVLLRVEREHDARHPLPTRQREAVQVGVGVGSGEEGPEGVVLARGDGAVAPRGHGGEPALGRQGPGAAIAFARGVGLGARGDAVAEGRGG